MNRREFLKCFGMVAAAPAVVVLTNHLEIPKQEESKAVPYSSAREALLAQYQYAEFQAAMVRSIAQAFEVPGHLLTADINNNRLA